MSEFKDWMQRNNVTVKMAQKMFNRSRRVIFKWRNEDSAPDDVRRLMRYWDIMMKRTEKMAIKEALKQYRNNLTGC